MGKPKEKQQSEILVSYATGEIVDNTETALNAIDDLDNQIRLLKQNKKQIKMAYKLDTKEMLTQKRFFVKLYKNNYETIFKNMSATTIKVLMFFIYNMSHLDNSVTINGVYPSQDVLIEKSGVGTTAFKQAMKTLTDMNIIISKRQKQVRKIYVNPILCEDSMTEKGVYYMFIKE